MKVGQQRVYDAKAMAGIDKHVRLASTGLYAIFADALRGELCCVLQCANCGCAHGHHAPPLGFRLVDHPRCLGWNFVPLPMQLVVFHFFYSYGLKGAEADVQRNLGNFDSACANLLEDMSREVRTRRPRCYPSPTLRKRGLVTIFLPLPA